MNVAMESALIHHQGHQGHKGRNDLSSVSLVSFVANRPWRWLAAAKEIVREACFGLYHHRFRAALSMLGISWGIISVVVLLAYGDGFGGALDAGFRGAFSDGTGVVWPGQASRPAGPERAGKGGAVTSNQLLALPG